LASFRKRGDRWEYRIKFKDPFSQKIKEKTKGGFRTKKEAQLAARDKEIQIEEGYEQTSPTLKHYLHEWLIEYKKGSVRKNTYVQHERNITKQIIPYFKNIKLDQVKPVMYQKFINHLFEDKKYSRRTVEIIHTTMTSAMQKAVTLDKLQKNPCQGVTIKGERKEREIEYIESDHIVHFLQVAYKYGYIYWLFFKVLIETGMRKGEAAALQWNDIDLKEKTISITKTLDFQAQDPQELINDPKTYSSKRTIKISQSLVNDLHFHKKQQNQNKLALNDIYHHDLNLVLSRNDGNFMPKSTLFNAFSRILKRAEIPSLPIHALRHTHAVILLESGASMKYVQERLGHGSLQITSDVYAHISKKIERDSMEQYEKYTEKFFE